MSDLNFLTFLILTLATIRISDIITLKAGPFDIFDKFRDWVCNDYQDVDQDKFFCELISCNYCFSTWVAGFIVISWIYFPLQTLLVSLPFALPEFGYRIRKLTEIEDE